LSEKLGLRHSHFVCPDSSSPNSNHSTIDEKPVGRDVHNFFSAVPPYGGGRS
jgi:hypothetical protein